MTLAELQILHQTALVLLTLHTTLTCELFLDRGRCVFRCLRNVQFLLLEQLQLASVADHGLSSGHFVTSFTGSVSSTACADDSDFAEDFPDTATCHMSIVSLTKRGLHGLATLESTVKLWIVIVQ